MRKIFIWTVLCGFLSISCWGGGFKDNKRSITTGTLFEEMIDLRGLTEFPVPAYRTVQFSSYDRRSRLPGGPGWFANSDGFGREPIPNFEKVLKESGEDGVGEYLICDMQGPGVVVRLWTAAITGRIRMCLDGQTCPLYEGPADEFFRHVYDYFPEGKNLDRSYLEKSVYQRDACYAPIPFAERLHIIWIGDLQTVHFYQVDVRIYPKGTEIVTFSPPDLVKYKETIGKVTTVLCDPDENWKSSSNQSPHQFELNLAPLESAQALFLEGPGALENLTVKVEAGDMDKALRHTVMQIICDEHPWGQVQCPVGDFFGAAPGINPYQSLPFSVHPDGSMVCRWLMPFKKSVKIRLDNQGEQTVMVRGSVQLSPYEWKDGQSMHFRALWRVNHGLVASNTEVQDLPFLIAQGKGVYVGTTSLLLNPSPGGKWWGEGDEKVFVDDDTLPSLFGTGTEDYYNYSYSSPDIFYFPYCGQPRNDGPDNRGFVTNFRWHILDAIPFQQMIRFYMELYPVDRIPGFSYARVAYHYAVPGVTDDHVPITPGDVHLPQLPKAWKPEARKPSLGTVFYEPEEIIDSLEETRIEKGRLWSRGNLLLWNPEKIGDKKSFSFEIEETAKIRIQLAVALTPNSGLISVALNGKNVRLRRQENIIDLQSPYRIQLRRFRFLDTVLESGIHKLTVTFRGAAKGNEEPEVGFDFIEVQKRK